MSCLLATLKRIGNITSVFHRETKMKARMALVCGTSLGVVYLYASDGQLISKNREKLVVRRK